MLAFVVPAGACSRSSPPADVCAPGALRCSPAAPEVCADDGTSWRAAACGQGQTCVAGTCGDPALCPDACRDVICAPGKRACADDSAFVYECDATGTRLVPCGSCAAANAVCSDGACVSLCVVNEKSNVGCEYFAVDLDNARLFNGFDEFGVETFLDAQNAQYAVIVANTDSSVPAYVGISRGPSTAPAPGAVCAEADPDPSFVAAAVVPPRGLHTFALPARNVDGTEQAVKAYRVAANVPITAFQFNPLANVAVFSNDASLLLPTSALGTDYYVMTRGQTFDTLKGYLTVVGVDPAGTEVTVTVSARTLAGVGIPALGPGEVFTTTLRRYELLNIETNFIGADLTGSTVRASRPVVVFGGSEAANAPSTSLCDRATGKCAYDQETDCTCPVGDPVCSSDAKCSRFITCCADHLEKQLTPVDTWDREYVAVRSFPRTIEKDVWRILAQAAGTTVVLEPPVAVVPTLGPGEWFELESDQDFVVYASQPVLVGQFLAAQDAPVPGKQPTDAGIGDPTFLLAVPVRQWRQSYVFLTPDKYALDYVSIAAPLGATVRLDGVDAELMPQGQGGPIAGSPYRALRVPLADGYHQLVCSAPCSVMVHGYDRYVSYGYPGGMNLDARSP